MGLPFLIRCPIPKTEQNFHHPHALFQLIWQGGGGMSGIARQPAVLLTLSPPQKAARSPSQESRSSFTCSF